MEIVDTDIAPQAHRNVAIEAVAVESGNVRSGIRPERGAVR